ncbi:hypothetical protein [Streptomyces sp. NPDC055186]
MPCRSRYGGKPALGCDFGGVNRSSSYGNSVKQMFDDQDSVT